MTQTEDIVTFIGGPLSGKTHRKHLPNPFFHEDKEGNQHKYLKQEVKVSPTDMVLCYIDATRNTDQARAIIKELFT